MLSLFFILLSMLQATDITGKAKKIDRRKPDYAIACCGPINNFTARTPQFQSLCDECTALKLVPLLTDQFIDNINFGKFREAENMLGCDNFFVGKIVMDEKCCQDVCGEIIDILGDFHAQSVQFKYKIMKMHYDKENGSVTAKMVLMQMGESGIERIFYNTMMWVAEVFCDYKLNYWELIEMTCTEEEYKYDF